MPKNPAINPQASQSAHHASSTQANRAPNPPINQVALIIRPDSPQLKDDCLQVIEIFTRHGIGVCMEEAGAAMLGAPELALPLPEILARAQAMVSLGGDGTLISAVHKSLGSALPVLGINMGRLGFLTAIKPSELEDFIPLLLSGEYSLDKHQMLEVELCAGAALDEAESKNADSKKMDSAKMDSAVLESSLVESGGCVPTKELHTKKLCAQKSHTQKLRTQKFYVLNEVLITKKDISGMVKIYAKVDDEALNAYYADGLIIATPTGSSAYNISAGGSVVHPACRVMLLTPVCAHSLTQRPMVISDDFVLRFEVDEDAMIMLDGQERVEFGKNDVLVVRKGRGVNLIQHPKRSYFAVMKEKFSWGGAK
ncbi:MULTISPECIES: NAD(+)/NADH kinase [unclassified Helicobacter]|uniref:NAD(+)/NADH kinase n=1 Tax=unclassified Helicobacter TaxID=2593540 RepID=UPI00131560D9|nr:MULTISPECIES: NAD(+)/NADH kinase [unclassified Helicobacter]